MGKDFLDKLIEENIANDPEYAKEWNVRQERRKRLASHLKSLRQGAGITQAEVALKLAVSRARVAVIEKDPGRVSIEQLMDYLAVVGGKIEIMGREADEAKPTVFFA